MLYTFLDEVTEGYCIHFYRKLQKDTVYICIGRRKKILHAFLDEFIEGCYIHF